MNLPYDETFLDAVETAIPAMNVHAREDLPNEAVGFILSDGDIIRLINQARSPNVFTVSRAQVADKLAMIDPDRHTIVALYHSHPSGTTTLSPTDQQEMRRTWTDDGLTLPWVTIVPNSRLAIWWLDPLYQTPRSALVRFEETQVA